MATFSKVPELVLHNILSELYVSVDCLSWLYSLRLVNHRVNEAYLHVVFQQTPVRKRPPACYRTCLRQVYACTCDIRRSLEPVLEDCRGLLSFQSALSKRNLRFSSRQVSLLLDNLISALLILRNAIHDYQVGQEDIQLLKICSKNPVFNDIPSAVLAQAAQLGCNLCLVGPLYGEGLQLRHYNNNVEKWCPEFWTALSACFLGDLDLFVKYSERVTQASSHSPEAQPTYSSSFYLKLASRMGRLSIVNHLLHTYPRVASDLMTHIIRPLRAAIRSGNVALFQIVLEHFTITPEFLERASEIVHLDPGQGNSSLEIVRIVIRHFAPHSSRLQQDLIREACKLGNSKILHELLKLGKFSSQELRRTPRTRPTPMHIVAHYGHLDCLRILINNGFVETCDKVLLRNLIEAPAATALRANHLTCFEELYRCFPAAQQPRMFQFLGFAENAIDIMKKFIEENDGILLQPAEMPCDNDPSSIPTRGQMAMINAMYALRYENVCFLLEAGVNFFVEGQGGKTKNQQVIYWPYFDQNRDTYIRLQNLLEARGLPKLRITFQPRAMLHQYITWSY